MYQITIRIPVFVTFSTDPAELDDREGEKIPTKESLLAYLKEAMRLDVDTEGEGQPEGAVFAASGVGWDEAAAREERCAKSPTGEHVPDPQSIQPADGAGRNRGTDWLIDVTCLHCGRGGSMRIDPSDFQW